MPNEETFTLYLSSGWHLTDSSKRLETLSVDPESVDIVFEENVTHNSPARSVVALNWLAVPLICTVLKFYLFGLRFASDQGWTDTGVVDELESLGAEVVNTDRNFHRILASERRYWSLGHWTFVVMAFFGANAWIQFTTPLLSILGNPLIGSLPLEVQTAAVFSVLGLELLVWYLAAGVIMTGFFIAGTTESRNFAMIRQIEDFIAENPDSSTGCLIVGGAHAPHLKELIQTSDRVEKG